MKIVYYRFIIIAFVKLQQETGNSSPNRAKPDIRQSDIEIFDFNPRLSLCGSGILLKIDRTFASIPFAESCFFSIE